MFRILFVLPDDRERTRTRTLPAVPRVGDHIGWQPDPDGYHEEHTVASVYWDLDGKNGIEVTITLDGRVIDGVPVNPPSNPRPGQQ